MMRIILAAADHESLAAFKEALEARQGVEIFTASSAEAALQFLAEPGAELLITGESLTEGTPEELVRSLYMKYPLVNVAMVDSRDHEDFHEATEGLGVLMQLASAPGKDDCDRLFAHLDKINQLFS